MTYVGTRDPKTRSCTVQVDGQNLPPRYDLRNHSPSGFEWGYNGSGPAQLALAILTHHLQDPSNHGIVLKALGCTEMPPAEERLGVQDYEFLALCFYQKFKSRVICLLPDEGWTLTASEVNHRILAY